MRQLPMVARLYLIVCYLAGAYALYWLASGYSMNALPSDAFVAVGLAFLAACTQLFVVLRSGSHHSDHLTPAPFFAALLLLPQPLLALVIIIAFLPEWVFYRRRWFIQAFNIASWLIAAALARYALYTVVGDHAVIHQLTVPADAIVAAGIIFLGVQTLLLALVLRTARGQTFQESGLFAPGKLATEGALLCSGWAFATAWTTNPMYGIAAAAPLALIFQALHVPNLKEEAATDPKTGLANMRHFNALFVRDLERAERSGQPISLLMCDLDFLRNINNTYGHHAGDVVLQGVADVIRHNIRGCDLAGRFGGEEFVILLADTEAAGARQVADRLRQELDRARFEARPDGEQIHATISIGVASSPIDGRTPDTLMREADLAVYQAKREGRNRVVVASRESRELAAEWARENLVPGEKFALPNTNEPKRPFQRFIHDVTRLGAASTSTQANGSASRLSTISPMAHEANKEAARPDGPSLAVALYIGIVVVAGLLGLVPGILAGRFAAIFAMPSAVEGLVLFTALTVFSQHFAVEVDPRSHTSVVAVPILAASFLFNEPGILLAGLVFVIVAKMKAHSPLYRMLFNFGMVLLNSEAAYWTLNLLSYGDINNRPFIQLILPAIAAGTVYYVVNHALLCIVRGLSEKQSPIAIWLDQYRWLWPHYIVLGVLGFVAAKAFVVFGWSGVLALMAPVAMMHVVIKQYMDRTSIYVNELRRMNARLSDSYEATLLALTRALDTRDEETEEHSQRVRRYTELLARRMGVPEADLEYISRGALLHDIGKIGVPDAVLLKPGDLTEKERALVRKHPTIGYSMIAHIPFLTKAAEVVLHHHEAYDGSGYPSGLSGNNIPLGARIFAVADTFDAMTSDRPYRSALPATVALAEIQRCQGKQFDPRTVDVLLAIPVDELLAAGQGVPLAGEQPSILFRHALEMATT